MKIRELDKATAEKIAAGEVIENPASVVKELVENALDAGATRVELKIEEGGRKSIAVTDNGSGIPAAEVHLAFKRFATSKLNSLTDLDSITSLGFRGEALPSIAAVSRVTLTTRTEDALAGTRIMLAGGEIILHEETGAPTGTTVEVSDLFFNTPGRLKFLRSAAAEQARITALVTGLCLAHPAAAFTLTGSSTGFQTGGDGNLLHAIGYLYGSETAGAMIPVSYRDERLAAGLAGYISEPHLHRSTRRQVTVVINGRVIQSPPLIAALARGYGNLLPSRRHPVAVLHLNIPPQALDVNVHPAKSEVRFQHPEAVKEIVYNAVRAALRQRMQPLPSHRFSGWNGRDHSPGPEQSARRIWAEKGRSYILEAAAEQAAEACTEITGSVAAPENAPGNCRLIGQFRKSYLLVQNGEELLIIDQHAAHERVLYNRLCELPDETGKKAVQLTMPQTLEVPAAWRETLEKSREILDTLGFKLEPFGDNSFIIRSVPFSEHGNPGKEELYNILEEVAEAEKKPGEERIGLIRKILSCHGAIKANRSLDRAEMEHLLAVWETTPDAYYCPHGRPAVLSLRPGELERAFRRKGG